MIDESWYQKPLAVPEETSAGGVVARLENKQIYIALVRENRGVEYVLPKGHLEANESLEQAAHREIEEEAGLANLQLIAALGVRERLNFSKRRWKKTHYFLFTTNQIEGSPTDPYIEYELHWFPLEQLPLLFWPEQQELIETNCTLIVELVDNYFRNLSK
ncbi:MAG: NUDIX domain-containing protein [Symploca sp. SIO2B6]|nr:NUDIX domain-containing protein [Symploca sp. SIO2B6]